MGQDAIYKGVGGNMFAFACKLSFEYGFQGYIAFAPKTDLIKHYQNKLFAQSISSRRMIIDTEGSQKIVQQYYKK